MKQTLLSIRYEMMETLQVWQALRKMGFPAESIFVAHGCPCPDAKKMGVEGWINVVVRHTSAAGEKKACHFHVIRWNGTSKGLTDTYADACELLAEASEEEVRQAFERHRLNTAAIILHLIEAGMIVNGKAI